MFSHWCHHSNRSWPLMAHHSWWLPMPLPHVSPCSSLTQLCSRFCPDGSTPHTSRQNSYNKTPANISCFLFHFKSGSSAFFSAHGPTAVRKSSLLRSFTSPQRSSMPLFLILSKFPNQNGKYFCTLCNKIFMHHKGFFVCVCN